MRLSDIKLVRRKYPLAVTRHFDRYGPPTWEIAHTRVDGSASLLTPYSSSSELSGRNELYFQISCHLKHVIAAKIYYRSRVPATADLVGNPKFFHHRLSISNCVQITPAARCEVSYVPAKCRHNGSKFSIPWFAKYEIKLHRVSWSSFTTGVVNLICNCQDPK